MAAQGLDLALASRMEQGPSLRTLGIMTVLPLAAILWLFSMGDRWVPRACFDSSTVQSLVIHENSRSLHLHACGTSAEQDLAFEEDFKAQRRIRAVQGRLLELQSLAHRMGWPSTAPVEVVLSATEESLDASLNSAVTWQWLAQNAPKVLEQPKVVQDVLVSLLNPNETQGSRSTLFLLKDSEVLAIQNAAWSSWISGKVAHELQLKNWAFANEKSHRFLRQVLESDQIVTGCPALSQDPAELTLTLSECMFQLLTWGGLEISNDEKARLQNLAARDVKQVFSWELAHISDHQLHFHSGDRKLFWPLGRLKTQAPTAQILVAEFCGGYPWDQLKEAEKISERVLIVESCKSEKPNDYAPLIRSGVEIFASLNPELRFAMIHTPSLRTAQKFLRQSPGGVKKWKQILDQGRGALDSRMAKQLRRHTGVLNIVEYSQGFPELNGEVSTLLSGHLQLDD